MYDSHCHLDLPAFAADRTDVLLRAKAAGILGILVPGVRPRTFDDVKRLRNLTEGPPVAIALGVHPQVVGELDAQELEFACNPDAIAAAALEAGAVAIGECGLDGGTGHEDRQERVFRAHVRAARLAGLPLVVHVLRAHGHAPRILRDESPVGGVMHSYSGGSGLVGVYRDLGFAFSLAGPITFPGARRPREPVPTIDDNLILVETDAPDQTPHPHRGQRNEPAYLIEIVAALAAARNEPPSITAALVTRNARRIFRLPELGAT